MAASTSTPRRVIENASPITPIPQRLPPGPRRASTLTPESQVDGRRGSSAATAAAAEQRRARREQLRSFYGLKGEAGGSADGEKGKTGTGVAGDPLDIDSPALNASAYYDDLISKQSLSGLMKTASTLSADIGNLEGSRHSLVYNHHHQLFAAGDTISHLNSRTPQLLSIVTNLQQSFSSISGLVDSVALQDPTASTGIAPTSADEVDSVARDVEKLRLMVLAEESPEHVQAHYESFRPNLENRAQDGDAKTQKLLKECKTMLEGMNQNSDPIDTA
ncbi:hypothetical protein IAR55_004578 [Kwoniella newhampshirensis]|uniref:Vacuolar protein sorting-associated protein 51 homolog n=1 Tax=Kwoniella newhampshirensis TaxID=1651941 RepID=A0AAW0YL65_9TREE